MKGMEPESVHCCITSPPYFGLRDYGNEKQIGLEETPDEYVAKMVKVFRSVWRVLRDDGTLWLVLGDSYAGSGPCGASYRSKTTIAREGQTQDGVFRISKTLAERGLTYADKKPIPPKGYKPKDLMGIPWRVALALQADGWYLRSDIIWHKSNPMPESVKDRPTKSHEYIFLLTKQKKYYYDHEVIKEEAVSGHSKSGSTFKRTGSKREQAIPGHSKGTHRPDRLETSYNGSTRNKRDVWTVATQPYKGAHFAVFPQKLIEPCVLAGCPESGIVFDPFCGAGTAGLVALGNGRNFIGIELNADYIELAHERIAKVVQEYNILKTD